MKFNMEMKVLMESLPSEEADEMAYACFENLGGLDYTKLVNSNMWRLNTDPKTNDHMPLGVHKGYKDEFGFLCCG